MTAEAPFDIGAFRKRRAALPLLPYGALDLRPALTASEEQALVAPKPSAATPLASTPGARWQEYAGHAWRSLRPFLIAHRRDGLKRWLDLALTTALDWISAHPHFVKGERLFSGREIERFAWLDMAVAQRLYRLSYLLDAIARREDIPDSTVAILMASAGVHRDAIMNKREFRAHNNHGLNQALALLAFARRFEDEPALAPPEVFAEATSLTRSMIRQQFLPDGGHNEHSPAYHGEIFMLLKNAISHGLIDDSTFDFAPSEAALAALVLPNGDMAAIGDTDRDYLRRRIGDPEVFQHPRLQQACLGLPAPSGPALGALSDSGYFFFNESTQHGDAALIQFSGFHSRVHKHADHASFIWYDRGKEILTDPGRFAYAGRTEVGSPLHKAGFWYSAPQRVFVESSAAHNTLEIDGQGHDRKARPFGSGLRRWGRTGDLVFSECEFVLRRKIRWARLLVLQAGRWLLVLDWIYDRSGEPHSAVQHFQFSDEWRVDVASHGLLAAAGDSTLSVLPLLTGQTVNQPRRGERDSDGTLHGWISDTADSLVPASSFAVHRSEAANQTLATVFAFGADCRPKPDACAVTTSGRRFRLAWQDGDRMICFRIHRPASGNVEIEVL